MKQIIYTTMAFLFTQLVYSQQRNLNIPVSPAFSILNFESGTVIRPTNVKSLSTDVWNAFDKNGKLLMNTGIEVSPYWLSSHSSLTLQQYLQPNFIGTIQQSLSISAATVKDSANGANKLGVGFRFKILNGEAILHAGTVADIRSLKTQTTISSILNGFTTAVLFDTKQKAMDAIEAALKKKHIAVDIIQQLQQTACTIVNDFEDTPAGISEFLKQLNIHWTNRFNHLQETISTQIYQRKGFIAELAGAGSFNTNNNSTLDRTGIWLNVSFFVSTNNQFTFTARQLINNNDTAFTATDAALSLLKKSDRFSVAIEAAIRNYKADMPDFNSSNLPILRTEKKTTYRFAIQGSFALSEQISLNLSFGKDFDSPFMKKNGFFSLLGFNYSIFSKVIEQLK